MGFWGAYFAIATPSPHLALKRFGTSELPACRARRATVAGAAKPPDFPKGFSDPLSRAPHNHFDDTRAVPPHVWAGRPRGRQGRRHAPATGETTRGKEKFGRALFPEVRVPMADGSTGGMEGLQKKRARYGAPSRPRDPTAATPGHVPVPRWDGRPDGVLLIFQSRLDGATLRKKTPRGLLMGPSIA